jgi:hypothetical protein
MNEQKLQDRLASGGAAVSKDEEVEVGTGAMTARE